MTEPSTPDMAPSRPRRRSRLRRWLPRAVFESVLIVFSVILALGLTQWAQDRRTDARVDDMRGFLAQEMRTNRTLLTSEGYLPHHEALKRDFYAAAGRQADPVDREATRSAMQNLLSTGLHPPQMNDAVWTSVSGGDLIEHMAPRDVFILAETYKAQAQLEAWSVQGSDTALALLDVLQEPSTAKNRLTRMVIYLEDLTSQERRLIALYDRAVAQMESTTATSPPVTSAAKTG